MSVGGGSTSLLIRAIGPTLGTLGVAGALADPSLRLESNGSLIAQNDDWSTGTAADALRQAAARVGAFPLPTASRDAAVQPSLTAGSFTAQVGGGAGVGRRRRPGTSARAAGRDGLQQGIALDHPM